MNRLALPALLLAALLNACSSHSTTSLPTVPKVDLARYMGKWYNLARLPASFQDGCTHSTADYAMGPGGTVSVVNRCEMKGHAKEVKGSARVVDTDTNAVLEVTFKEWFSAFIPKAPQGNYFVIWLAPDYSAAAVGTPDRKYLWILSRNPSMSTGKYLTIVDHCKELGFDVGKLIIEDPKSIGGR